MQTPRFRDLGKCCLRCLAAPWAVQTFQMINHIQVLLFDGMDWNPQSQIKFIRKSARNTRIEYVCETLNLWQMEARWENQTLGEKAREHYRRAYLAKKGELTELLENDVM